MYHFKTGKITENIYLIDTLQFTINRITAAYCYWDGETAILFDTGTSENIDSVLNSIQQLGIPLQLLQAIVPSHYHFDHGGGALALWRKMQQYNPDFQIYTTSDTLDKLQHPQDHLKGAQTTFGKFVGEMIPIPEDQVEMAYKVIHLEKDLPLSLQDGYTIKIIATPGHTHDHKSPVIYKNGKPVFLFAGEALGTYFAHKDLLSLPSAMPPNYDSEAYFHSVNHIKKISPQILGFCHFGALEGHALIEKYIEQHIKYTHKMEQRIPRLYEQQPRTRYVIETLKSEGFGVHGRLGEYYIPYEKSPFFANLFLAVTFAMMVDLGLKKPKYEQPAKKIIKK